MKISFFLFKHRKQLLIYTIGLALILTLLYLLILRHSGYIYYWDLSGAFDFRDPFSQYFNIYTPWDGNNVGVRNRLPIVFSLYILLKPLLLVGVSNEIVIKVATSLIFVGAYTVMYFLAPKFVKIFAKTEVEKQSGIYIWALIIALLYSFIPFYVYRVSQLHLFYMSIFYPIHIYLFIKLFESPKISRKYISLFVLSMFFGLTSPNIIVFDIFSFGIIGLFLLIIKIKERGSLKSTLYNLLIAGIFVLITNIYWLFPYFVQGSPSPGYVINSMMIDLLSQGVTLGNFLLGQADWFVNQSNLGVLETKDEAVSLLQIFGVIVFYTVSLFGLVRYLKKRFVIPIIIFLLISPLLIFNIFPFQRDLQEFLLYSPLGWIFREVNRVSFFWWFWIYILFLIGTYSIYESILLNGWLNKILKVVILPVIFIPFLIFLIPINIKFFEYLKPTKIPTEVTEVFNILEEDSEYFSVLYYPNIDSYSLPWMKDKFLIADSEEYKLLAYNSPKPPVGISSVIPNQKTYQKVLTEYLIQNREIFPSLSYVLSDIGVKYIVVSKTAEPINLDVDYIRAEVVYPVYLYLENDFGFEEVLDNEYYAVFKNTNFEGIISNGYNDIYTNSSFNILEHLNTDVIGNYNIKFCGFEENYSDCYDQGSFKKTYLKYESDDLFYLDFLSKDEKEKYGIYPYEHTYTHGIGIDWGRASYFDKINGELHNVFRRYGINGWNFEITDKVVYSDKPFVEKESKYESIISFEKDVVCKGNCEIFAYVLYNHIGGKLHIKIDETEYQIDTKESFENYKWVKLGDMGIEKSKVKIDISNIEGFSSIGGILILPEEKISNLGERVDGINVINVPEDNFLSSEEIDIYPENCEFTGRYFSDSKITAKTNCEDLRDIYLSNYHYDTIVKEQGGVIEIYLNSAKNIYLLSIFVLTFVLTVPVTILFACSKKRFF